MTEVQTQHRMPFHMVWLATNVCNARCEHCSSASDHRLPNELTKHEVFQLFDQLKAAGVVDLAIFGGEPLLRPDIFDIIAYAKMLGFAVGIGSNGSSITPISAARLSESRVDRVQISLDGLAEAHDRLRRWPGLFSRAVRAIELASKAGVRTHVCCTINRYNFDQLQQFTEFMAAETQIARINFSRYVPTGRGRDQLDLDDDQWRKVIVTCSHLRMAYHGRLDIVSHLAQQVLVDATMKEIPAFIGCQAGAGQGCVTSDGTVFPCVLLPIPLGNIRKNRFEEIWRTSPVVHNLQHRERLEGLCGSCAVAAKCGGCRAIAYARTGNYMATDPRCWLGSC